MRPREEAIAEIKNILNGSGCYEQRKLYPEDMIGIMAKLSWHNSTFTLGWEYGIIGTLIKFYDIKSEELFDTEVTQAQ